MGLCLYVLHRDRFHQRMKSKVSKQKAKFLKGHYPEKAKDKNVLKLFRFEQTGLKINSYYINMLIICVGGATKDA